MGGAMLPPPYLSTDYVFLLLYYWLMISLSKPFNSFLLFFFSVFVLVTAKDIDYLQAGLGTVGMTGSYQDVFLRNVVTIRDRE